MIPRGAKIRPVEKLQTYLAGAGIAEGEVFRQVRRGGHITQDRLTTCFAGGVVQRYAGLLGLDAKSFGGHSLRSDFLTSAAENGAMCSR